MTASWARRKLGDLLSVQNGYAFDSKAFGATGFPLIRIRDLKTGVSTETRYGAEFDPRYVVNAGDFLIGMDGEFACYEWKGEPALLNQRVCRLQGFNGVLEPRFLFHGINAHLKAIEEVTGYTTVKHLSSKQILGIELLVPPRDEQRRIVAILDEAFEGIATAKANAKKNLQNAREWAAGELSMVLSAASASGRSGTLETLVAPSCTLSYGIVQPGDEVPSGLPVVRPVDLGERTVYAEGLKRIDPALARSYARTTLEGNDLLLCVRGTTGTVAIAEPALAGANVTRGIVPIRFDPRTINQILGYYLLRSEPVQEQIRAKTYGTALMQINIGDLRKILVAYPPMEKQAALVAQLDAIQEAADQLIDVYRRKLAAFDELKKSLLHQAFAGALTTEALDKQLEAVA